MTTLQVLIDTKALIDKPNKWTTNHLEFFGKRCIMGALNQVIRGNSMVWSPDDHPAVIALDEAFTRKQKEKILEIIHQQYGTGIMPPSRSAYIASYNNANDHNAIMALLDRAIARQKILEAGLDTRTEVENKELVVA